MIEFRDVSLPMGTAHAIDRLNLTVARGEILGLIGPIGSGKSTTLKLLTGIIDGYGGQVLVDGLDLATNGAAIRARIGYMPGFIGAYNDLRVRDYLDLFARACRVDPATARARMGDLLRLAGLDGMEEAFISSLEIEQRHRLAVIKTAIHDPSILLFDEPAVSLANDARIRLRELIGELARVGGRTVVVCTNILTDLLGLCDRIGIMYGGRLLKLGLADEVARCLTRSRILELETREPAPRVIELLRAHPSVDAANTLGEHVLASLAGEVADPAVVIREVNARGAGIVAFREHQIDLQFLAEELSAAR